MKNHKKLFSHKVRRAALIVLALIIQFQVLPDTSYTSSEGASSSVTNVTTTNPFKLGRSLIGFHDKFTPDALFDDLRVYDGSLSDNQIRNIATLLPEPKNHWTFDESSGLTAVDSAGNKEGTLSIDAFHEKGAYNGAVHLNGTDSSYVTFDYSVGQFKTNDFTTAFWLKTSDKSDVVDLLGNRTASSHGNFFGIRMKSSGTIVAEIDQDNENYIITGSERSGLNNDEWHHVAVTRAKNTLKIYIDGMLSNQATSSGIANVTTTDPFKLGRSVEGNFSNFTPDASFDDLRIYDVALSDDQIQSMAALMPTPKNYWKFDESSGLTAIDSTGNKNGALSNEVTREPGIFGSAVHLNGTDNSYVTFDYSVGQFKTNDFTTAFWLKTTDRSGIVDLLGNRTKICYGSSFGIRMNSEGDIIAEIDEDGQNYINITGRSKINDGVWHHVAVTREADTMKLYIDGILSDHATNRIPKTTLTNVVEGNYITSTSGIYKNDILTDGIKDNFEWSNTGEDGCQWIQFDLKKSMSISGINLWHYFGDERKYHDVIVQLSNSKDFSADVITVFNNDRDNSAGQGIGTDEEYIETISGKTIKFNSINARYARFWSAGNTLNNDNHYVEVEILANVAPGKYITSSSYLNDKYYITDCNKDSDDFAITDQNYSQWMQFDLGKSMDVSGINLWQYFDNKRRYHDVIVQLSNHEDFSRDVITVFNNDKDNSAGQGTGTDEEYVETSSGKNLNFDSINARYIRFWSNGNTYNPANQYVEVEILANVARYTTNDCPGINNKTFLTDGYKGTDCWSDKTNDVKNWLAFDLGRNIDISGINIWRYFPDARYRIFHDVIIQLSNSKDFSDDVTTVFNNDYDNSEGLGFGNDEEYIETSSGKSITFNSTNSRYVRFWSNGNNLNTGDQYTEIEILGSALFGIDIAGSCSLANENYISDGKKDYGNFCSTTMDGCQWIQFDLGTSKSISGVNLWHYFGDARKYHDVIVQLSNSPDFSRDVKTVFNNDNDNSAGQGIGNDEEYTETSDGKSISFKCSDARYIRIWSNGNTKDNGNHYVEVEAVLDNGMPADKGTVTATAKATTTATTTATSTPIPAATPTAIPAATTGTIISPVSPLVAASTAISSTTPTPAAVPIPTAVKSPASEKYPAAPVGIGEPSPLPESQGIPDWIEIPAWARDAVVKLLKKKIISGDEHGNINPNKIITRNELPKVLDSLLELKPGYNRTLYFKDKSEIPKWVVPYLNTAIDYGLIKGYDDNSFRGSVGVTRAQGVTALIRVLNKMGKIKSMEAIKSEKDIVQFSDFSHNYWAASDLKTAVLIGLIKGYPDNTIRPDGMVTRAEFFTMIANVIE